MGSFADQEVRQAVKIAIEKGKEIREIIRGATAKT
jgi:hypothetical protein